MEKSFLEALEPFVNHCFTIVEKSRNTNAKVDSKLKLYKASLKVLKDEFNSNKPGECPKIESNIKSFRKLLKQIDSTITNMTNGDFDDSWIWMKSSPARIIYTKNGVAIDKIAIYLNEIYQYTKSVKSRYQFMILLFTVMRTVCNETESKKQLKSIINTYLTKIKEIPEEEDICDNESDEEGGKNPEGSPAEIGNMVKGILGQVGINEKTLSQITSRKPFGGDDEDDSEEESDESDSQK